jgi:copper transport protein
VRIQRATGSSILAVVLGLLTVATAWAHAELRRAEPAPGAVIQTAPARVRIWFTEPIIAPPNALQVTGPDGRRVDHGDAHTAVDDTTALEATVGTGGDGTYSVGWRAISADGHPVSGSYQFSLGSPSQGLTPPEESERSGGLPGLAASRGLHLLGLVVLLGPMLFGLLVLGEAGQPVLDRRLWAMSQLGVVLLVLATPLMLVAQAIGVGGSVTEGLRADTLTSVLISRWGVLWNARLGVAGLLVGLTWWIILAPRAGKEPGRRRRLVAGLALGALLLVLTSLNGHPASTDPVWLSVLLDTIHLAATAAWIGGLLVFGIAVLPALRGYPGSERVRILGQTVPRFSTLSLVSVELLVLTGLYQVWAHVEGPAALTTTGYGQALLVKLGLVVAVLGLASVNLLALRPRVAAAAQARPQSIPEADALARRFGWLVGAEAVLGVAILGVVGMLTALPPARGAALAAEQRPAPGSPAVTLAENAGPTLVTLSIDPADLGANRLVATLQDLRGKPVGEARLRVRAVPEAGGAASVTTMSAADGRYQATVSLAPAGQWRLEVLVALPGESEQVASFELAVPVLGTKWCSRQIRRRI